MSKNMSKKKYEELQIKREHPNRCDGCNIYCEKLYYYGAYWFCRDCAKKQIKRFGKAKSKLDLSLPLDGHSTAHYEHDSTIVLGYYDLTVKETIKSICHETMHYVIHKIAGIKACYQFDYYGHQNGKLPEIIVNGVEVDQE